MSHKGLLIVIMFSAYTALAQTNSSDTAFFKNILDSTIAFYTKSLGQNSLLFNGREYTGSYSRTIGHPFYASDRPQKGSILYDRIAYPHSAIMYDLTTDEIFIKTVDNISLKLINEKIERFSLGEQMFVRMTATPDKNGIVSDGFYEVLYDGAITVFAKRKKQLEPTFNLEDPYRFVQYNSYFIKMNDTFHEVKSEKSLLLLFPGYQKDIRKYMRTTRVRFKKDPETFVVRAAEHYSQIKK